MFILSGDVGGTNSRLKLSKYNLLDSSLEDIFLKKYKGADFISLSDIVLHFLSEAKVKVSDIKSCCFAVAGAIVDGIVELTNLPWLVSEKELRKDLNIRNIKLINDFSSNCYGLKSLDFDKDIYVLQKGNKKEDGMISMIGAGTGIGVSHIFIDDNNKTNVITTEGGHTDFSPTDREQMDLLLYMRKKLHRVSLERICCGLGFMNIYKYVISHPLYNQKKTKKMRLELFRSRDKAATITDFALNKGDPCALRTLDIFIKVYGSATGNLALMTMPKRGLYISGGIAPKLFKQMTDGRFMEAFYNKGRMSELLTEIPVYIILNTDIGIYGATNYAISLIESNNKLENNNKNLKSK